MFIKRTTRRVGPKTYVNHLLVESVATRPARATARSVRSARSRPRRGRTGGASRTNSRPRWAARRRSCPIPRSTPLAARVRPARGATPGARRGADLVAIHTDQVEIEDVREAGPVHVGHQMWRALALDPILAAAGLSARTRVLTEVMTLNRLVQPGLGARHAGLDPAHRPGRPARRRLHHAQRRGALSQSRPAASAARARSSRRWPRASARCSTWTTRSISTT